MIDQAETLRRIAETLDRIAPPPSAPVDWLAHPAYVWHGTGAYGVPNLEAPSLNLIRGIDSQKDAVVGNVERLAAGAAAHDMLLWGARGMGKSVLIRAAAAAAGAAYHGKIALVQASADAGLATLFGVLRGVSRHFLVFIDDLGFDDGNSEGPRKLRSWLEGGVEARPGNVRLAVTSNRRAIIERHMREQDDPINPRDAVDDQLALADRFGLSLGFHACSQDDYLMIIAGYAAHYRLDFDPADALQWSKRRGSRSGRIAWHYVTELAGRTGRQL